MAGGDDESQSSSSSSSIRVQAMQFAYYGQSPLFSDFNLDVSPGSRCLLVGTNGSGKTTLLKILAGKHMVGGRDVVRVLNCSAFHDTQLVCSGDLSYSGGSWRRGFSTRRYLCKADDIWSGECTRYQMGSEGVSKSAWVFFIPLRMQQLAYWLMQVLLLDEVIVDLDVVARLDLLDCFKEECDQRGATIVYATHIFDGLETWTTDLVYIQDGELKRKDKLSNISKLKMSTSILSVVESWLRPETKIEKKKTAPSTAQVRKPSPFDTAPFRLSRHMAYYR